MSLSPFDKSFKQFSWCSFVSLFYCYFNDFCECPMAFLFFVVADDRVLKCYFIVALICDDISVHDDMNFNVIYFFEIQIQSSLAYVLKLSTS